MRSLVLSSFPFSHYFLFYFFISSLGVLALPSQAVKSLLSGIKQAHSAAHARTAASKASNAASALAVEGTEYRYPVYLLY